MIKLLREIISLLKEIEKHLYHIKWEMKRSKENGQ